MAAREETENTPAKSSSGGSGPTEFEPPLACVRRLLKNTLPSSTNVGKDASSAFARACGIFVVYLTACANDFARENKRQTITANDILAAVKEVDFDEFTPKLTTFIDRHRRSEKAKRARKKSVEETNKTAGSPSEKEETAHEPGADIDQSHTDADDNIHAKKRRKRNDTEEMWETEDVDEDSVGDGHIAGDNIQDDDGDSQSIDTEEEE